MTAAGKPRGVRVVGVSFIDGYPGNLQYLALRHDLDRAKITLQHNPGNLYDENAIEVYITGRMVGHLPRGAAKVVARQISKVVAYGAAVQGADTDRPGLTIILDRTVEEADLGVLF